GVVGTFADITERMRAEEALRESEERYRELVERSPQGIVVRQGDKYILANRAFADMVGYSIDELLEFTLDEIYALVHPDDHEMIAQRYRDRQAGKVVPDSYEHRFIRKDGESCWARVTVAEIEIQGEQAFLGMYMDVTKRKRAEREIEERQTYLEGVLGAAPDAIVTLDAHHRIVEWNAGAAKLFGYSQEEVIGRNLDDLVTNPDVYEEATGFTQRALGGKEVPPTEGVRYRKDGSPVDVLLAGSPILVGDELIGVVAVYTDITARVRMEETLRALALLDELTNLYNRRGFSVLAEQQLKMAERGKRKMLLLFADLDGLKWINDTFGHSEGDRALMETADVLEETFRESDIVARIGGDEFVVLAVETNGSPAEVLVHRLQENLEARNARRDRRYELSLSVGLARYDPERPCSIEELLTQADRAMYERKQG
ncbi:MAG: PAS domain S-box protein, partial [Anaerolineae bacterium]